MQDNTIIEGAIEKLTPELKAEHDKCLAQGLKDEICVKCGSIFLAHHHFVNCSNSPCPMSNGKTFFEMWHEHTEKEEAKNSKV